MRTSRFVTPHESEWFYGDCKSLSAHSTKRKTGLKLHCTRHSTCSIATFVLCSSTSSVPHERIITMPPAQKAAPFTLITQASYLEDCMGSCLTIGVPTLVVGLRLRFLCVRNYTVTMRLHLHPLWNFYIFRLSVDTQLRSIQLFSTFLIPPLLQTFWPMDINFNY